MMTYRIILTITLLLTALISGLYYAWSVSVIPGLYRLNDMGYLQSMQQMNRAILNPLFFLSFMGTLVMLPVCTWFVYRNEGISPAFLLMLAAALLYVVGSFGVTMAGNVPLNNMLDSYQLDGAGTNELQSMRAQFEEPWNKLHRVRSIANAFSLLCAIAAAVFR